MSTIRILSLSGTVIYESEASDVRAALVEAVAQRVVLGGAYLRGADLGGADLGGAYLGGAYLGGAYLGGADLGGAYLGGADLGGAKWRDNIVLSRAPLFIDGLKWRVSILNEHMEIGCELHRIDEWAAFDDATINKMDRGALKWWRAHKDALLALARADGRGEQSQ